jgi:hypothetical protein
MDPDAIDTFDAHLWEGYLWSPRFSDDLLSAFKSLFFKVLANLEQIPERVRDHGPQLFIQMAVLTNRGISTEEAKGALYNMNTNELVDRI